jgi:DNA ligase-1
MRRVTPQHVFQLAFEAVQRSTRHKSGVAARFPRIRRWHAGKTVEQADMLDTVCALIQESAST